MADLVKRLADLRDKMRKDSAFSLQDLDAAMTDAITALSSQATRDGVLEEVRRAQPPTDAEPKTAYGIGFLNGVLAYGRVISTLKQQPTEAQRMERRTGPDDRRESAHGTRGPDGALRRGSLDEGMVYGRRSGDRARWTAQPAPQAGPTMEFAFANYFIGNGAPLALDEWSQGDTTKHAVVWIIRELDRLSAMGGK